MSAAHKRWQMAFKTAGHTDDIGARFGELPASIGREWEGGIAEPSGRGKQDWA